MTSTLTNFFTCVQQGNEHVGFLQNFSQVAVDTPSNFGIAAPTTDGFEYIWRILDTGITPASTAALSINMWEDDRAGTPTATLHNIAATHFYLEDTTPGNAFYFSACTDSNGAIGASNIAWRLGLETNGDVIVENAAGSTIATATDPLTQDQWMTLVVRWRRDGTNGEVQVWVDGTDIFSGNQTGQSLGDYGSAANSDEFWMSGYEGETGSVHAYYSGGYCMINSTTDADRLADTFEITGPYQDTAITGATPDNGDALDGNGQDWATVNEIPFSDETKDTDSAEYVTGALAGSIHYDGGSRPGPDLDSRIDGDSNIEGWKGTWRLERGNGSATVHTIYMGDDGATWSSGFDSDVRSVANSPGNHHYTTDVSTNQPASGDNFSMGIGKNGGGRELHCHEMASFILHVPDAAPAAGFGLLLGGHRNHLIL